MTALKLLIFVFIWIPFHISQANSWDVNGLTLNTHNQTFNVQIDELSFSQIDGKIENIDYKCGFSVQLYPTHHCDKGRVSFDYLKTKYNFQFKGWFDLKDNQWVINLFNESESLSIHYSSEFQDNLKVKLLKMPVVEFFQLLKEQVSINEESLSGFLTADLDIDFSSSFKLFGNFQLENYNWESDASEYVLAETKILGEFLLRPSIGGYELLNTTSIVEGEGLFKDIYLVFEKDTFLLNSAVEINNEFEFNNLELDLHLTDANNIIISVKDLAKLDLDIDFEINDLSVLYQNYLKSYLSILGISKAEIEGKTKGQLIYQAGEFTSIKADVNDLFMEIEKKKIEINNLNSKIDWHKDGDFLPSSFSWDALLLAGMPINQSQLSVTSAGQELIVQENTQVPIFDGSLDINKLSLKNIFEPEISIQFDGEVQPISLSLITEKMGWPVMTGSISGKIPGMKKIGPIITFDGLLELSVFDGNMQIEGLSIERLFGIAPVIAADIKFQNLSLYQITNTYDFGDITGNINGYVNGMRITNWKADRLDAYIESVKTKGVKQLISQRAIDNISSIGGVQGALSRSFLRFFDAFKYKKLGIGCKLRNSICHMKGINSATNNYQIVKGSGLPSINIFGYRTYIDWQIFLNRLLNAKY